MRIQDKVVVITGGASGLGLATAHYLVEEKGARVAIFDLNVEAGDKAVADLGADRAMFVQTDVSSEESVQQAVAAVMARFGAIHVCINGAAMPAAVQGARQGRQGDAAREVRADAPRSTSTACSTSCPSAPSRWRATSPRRGEERGVVINVSSGAAYEGQIGQCAYAATKAGVIGMNMPAARELGAIGVRVNAIAPGLFLTPMVAGARRESV